MSSSLGLDRKSDQDDDDTQRRPPRADGVNHRQEPVPKGTDDQRHYADGVEDQQQLPILRNPVRVIHCQKDRTFKRMWGRRFDPCNEVGQG